MDYETDRRYGSCLFWVITFVLTLPGSMILDGFAHSPEPTLPFQNSDAQFAYLILLIAGLIAVLQKRWGLTAVLFGLLFTLIIFFRFWAEPLWHALRAP